MSAWVIAAGDFTPLGGMDRANHALARFLASTGREVHLVAHRVWPDVAQMRGVTVHHAPRPLGSHVLGGPLLARTAGLAAHAVSGGARLLANGGNTSWRESATWIHYLHAAFRPEIAGGVRARVVGPLVHRRDLARERAAIDRAPLIICNSRRTADHVRDQYRVEQQRLRVIYYGTDPLQFGPIAAEERDHARTALGLDRARPLAVFIGALGDRRKGFDVLFDAWRRLCASVDWDADLLVVGSGGEVAAWEQRAIAERLTGRIRFLRFRTDVPQILAASDVLVHPARYEAYGLGVHEAVCRGLPAIVSAQAGVTERLPSVFQALAIPDPPSVDALEMLLRRWRGDADAWRQRGIEAGDFLRTRTWDDMAAEIAIAVEQL